MSVARAGRLRAAPAFAVAALGAALYLAAPPWPDDWDGLGFLASVTRFDLDAFAPHPPGYPVYVALLRVAGLFASPMNAARLVAGLSGAAAVALAAAALGARGATPWSHRFAVALALVVTPLGLRCATAVGSEAPALALTGLALYGLAASSPGVTGIGVGLALGVRLSWAPLLVPMLLLAPRRRAAVTSAAVAVLAWATPLVAVVGPAHLARLLRTHLAGHATRWGGTALTEPSRARYLLRDLFVDGFGVDADALGAAIPVALVAAAACALLAWRRRGWAGARGAAWIMAPYVAWIAVGQNLREQPRHVLPLVTFVAGGLAIAGWVERRARAACLALFALVAARAALDARDRRRDPPAGAALVDYARARPDAGALLVFGGASVRYFDGTPLAPRAFSAETLGDVAVRLARVDDPPAVVLVTGEVRAADRSGAPVATFCRPERIDRRAPCLAVYALDAARVR